VDIMELLILSPFWFDAFCQDAVWLGECFKGSSSPARIFWTSLDCWTKTMHCHLCWKMFQYQKITPLCEDVRETCHIMAAICGSDMSCLQQIFLVSYFQLSFIDHLYILMG
jgi:hypothetical protein